MKKSVGIALFIIGVCLLLGCYFGYKVYIKYTYSVEKLEKMERYANCFKGIENAKTIVLSEPKQDFEKTGIGHLSMRNDFGDFEKKESSDSFGDAIIYTKLNDDGTMNARISIGKLRENLDLLKEDTVFYGEEKLKYSETKEKHIQFLEKENIKNDLDLIDFLVRTKKEKISVFTPVNRMKNIYDIHLFLTVAITNVMEFTYLKGNVEGYLIKVGDNIYECNLYKENERYTITFMGSLFTENYINELLNTLSYHYDY